MNYVALGDSISIDDYPERETGCTGLGAASLFRRNDDKFWPEFRGWDLARHFPASRFANLTADGATSEDVLRWQLPRVSPSPEETIVTVTAGGNDMLMNLRSPRPPANLVEGMIDRVEKIVAAIQQKLPRAHILLGTVYDPSDGTNVLYGERLDREARWLATFNEAVRRIANRDGVTLIDIHQHFLGHGVSAPEEQRWYWSELIFEPNARGASEVRRLWWEATNGARIS
jgi:lysophospholipase L1-like esterase